jgi:1,4-alpha-glucan branching enzyme
VRVLVDAPPQAGRVELVGDFTVWEALPMVRRGDRWEVELEVEAGTHHYGYLVDGEWFMPDDERSVVPDEWGRSSAILVIEPELIQQ